MREFDWDEFKSHLVAVHYKNKAEENNFLKNAEKHKFANDAYRCDNLPDKDYYISVFTFSGFDGFNNSVMKVAEIDGYKILEWGDYMEFTENDLKVGMLVETNYGFGIIMPTDAFNVIVYEKHRWGAINFNNIKNVWGHSSNFGDLLICNTKFRPLLYTRKIVKEMTVDEISKVLGYEVKIIRS